MSGTAVRSTENFRIFGASGGLFWGYFLKNFPEKSRGVNLNFTSRGGVRGVRP